MTVAVTNRMTPPIWLLLQVEQRRWLCYVTRSGEGFRSTTRLKMRYSQAVAIRDLMASEIMRAGSNGRLMPDLNKVETMASEAEKQRFRSFSERYVVERAATFTNDDLEGLKDAHKAVIQSRKVYELIASVAETLHTPVESANQAQTGQAVQQGPSPGPYSGPTSQAMTQSQLQAAVSWRQRMTAQITGRKTP